MIKNVFDRYEKKYLMEEEKYLNVLNECKKYMGIDQYGLHTICNIYYDTDDYELIRTSIERPPYKEKFRLRSYGVPQNDSTVFLEIKKKYRGIVNKRRESMDYKTAINYLKEGIKPIKQTQILKEIEFFLKRYSITPKVFLAYDRIALLEKEDSEFRVTFDSNIRTRDYDLDLRKGIYGDLVIGKEKHLMEVKMSEAIPMWFVDILNRNEVYPTSFSKYGTVYKKKILDSKEQSLQVLTA